MNFSYFCVIVVFLGAGCRYSPEPLVGHIKFDQDFSTVKLGDPVLRANERLIDIVSQEWDRLMSVVIEHGAKIILRRG